MRSAGNRLWFTGQLVDAVTGTHLWAERFDGDLKDVFDLQDQITYLALLGHSHRNWSRPRSNMPNESRLRALMPMTAICVVWRAFSRFTPIFDRRAPDFFDRAIELDPGFASAYGTGLLVLHYSQ